MKIQFCPYCGTKLDEGAFFCKNCGEAIANDTHKPQKPKRKQSLTDNPPNARLFMKVIYINVQIVARFWNHYLPFVRLVGMKSVV